tara:strand:- start:6992 stop:8089 length:1098 start_codon:yes stop_codon:yes gene_type:complete
MSEFQEDSTNLDDALDSFVSIEKGKHGVEGESTALDVNGEATTDDDRADEPAEAADDGQAGQPADDSASGDGAPPKDSAGDAEGDGSQAGAGEDTRTRKELLDALGKSEQVNARLEHTNDSNVGRVKALQRKSQSLRNQLTTLRTVDGPSRETAREQLILAEGELDQIKEEMGEDYPATMKLVETALRVNNLRTVGMVDERLAPVRQTAEVLINEQVRSGSDEVADILSAKYDVPGMVNSQGFQSWIEVLHPAYREIFEKSEDPAEQLMILDSYAIGRDVSEFLVDQPAQPKPVSTTSPENKLPASNDAVRKQQEQDAADIDGKAAAPPDPESGITDDSAEASYAYTEQEKQRKRGGKTRRVEIS